MAERLRFGIGVPGGRKPTLPQITKEEFLTIIKQKFVDPELQNKMLDIFNKLPSMPLNYMIKKLDKIALGIKNEEKSNN